MNLLPPEKPELLKMPEQQFANLVFIDATFNGQPAALMFDTGAAMTMLRRSLVERINGKFANEKVKGGNSAGQALDMETALIPEIRIGSAVITDLSALVLPDECFDFGDDENGNSFSAQGFLGWDIISQFCWEIDPKSCVISLEKSRKTGKHHNLSWNNFPIIDCRWMNQNIKLGFDSGHTETMLDNTWQDKLEHLSSTTDTLSGIGGSSDETIAVAGSFEVTIGGKSIRLVNVPVVGHEIYGAGGNEMSGLLGADVVHNRRWLIDFNNHHFELD
jgi:hypothetical protein